MKGDSVQLENCKINITSTRILIVDLACSVLRVYDIAVQYYRTVSHSPKEILIIAAN